MAEVSSPWVDHRARANHRTPVAMAVRQTLRRGGVTSTAPALAVLMALAATPARSQDASGPVVEEVIVTGIRQQLETSQARKANAEEILDSITASDIGALPDRSVTEVLQRIPGLAIGR